MASSSDIGGRIVGMRFASIVLPAPGGPMNKMLCPPAHATSRARLAACCPCTSRRSTEYCAASESICRASTLMGVNDSGEFTKSTACGKDLSAKTFTPSTTAASLAFASGTAMDFSPNSRAASAADSAPAHRPNASVQRELSEKHAIVELLSKELSHAARQTEGHRKIKSRSFLPDIGRRQVYRYALPIGKLVPAVSERALDALPAFFHRVIRQPNDVEVLHPRRAHIHLDLGRCRRQSRTPKR